VSGPSEHDLVFNVVWTGSSFTYLYPFVSSLIDHSEARFRFVANDCPPDQIARMEAYAEVRPDRVVDVLDVSPDAMIRHGLALDAVLAARDDGPWFSLIDPDIMASGPFLGGFLDVLAVDDAVTSGTEVWSDDNYMPEDKIGLAGEYFFRRSDGYVYGSPHLAIYDRAALDETLGRWHVGFGSAGDDIPAAARSRLAEAGHEYWVYDTGKVVNILYQEDGRTLRHLEERSLLHVGGVTQFLCFPGYVFGDDTEPEAMWKEWDGQQVRYAVARYTARVLRELLAGREPPEILEGPDPAGQARLVRVRDALVDLVARYGETDDDPVAARPGEG
jgi:hypothetical protein